jgi:PKHD-type hydroxylase
MDHLIKNNIKINIPEYGDINSNGGGWSLEYDHVENWAWASSVFSKSELDAICNMGSDAHYYKGTTIGASDEKMRNSFVSFIFPNENTYWLFDRLAQIIHNTNNSYFKFDITGMIQGLQFTQYSSPGEHYSWHIDRGIGCRKLSLSLQLSDPDEYDGGDLELWFGGEEPIKMKKEKGMMTFFPSYALHRVSPVTRGTRRSLVCWISGPPFK